MRIFLTGATGFIGRNLLKALVKEGYEVVSFIRNRSEGSKFKEFGSTVCFGTLENFKKSYLKNIDTVIHLGAIRTEWGFSPSEYLNVNVEGTKKILEASKENGVKHFIYCSTAFVFGFPPRLPITEKSSFSPTSLYARSKLDAEKIVKTYFRDHGLSTTILRPTITYGPDDFSGMLLKLCRLIWKNKFLIVGEGNNYLHLTSIDDVVQGFLKSLKKGGSGKSYLICSDSPIRLETLSLSIAKEYHKKIWPVKIPAGFAWLTGLFLEKIYKFGKKIGLVFFQGEPFITRSKVEIISKSQWFSAKKAKKELKFHPHDKNDKILEVALFFKKNEYL